MRSSDIMMWNYMVRYRGRVLKLEGLQQRPSEKIQDSGRYLKNKRWV